MDFLDAMAHRRNGAGQTVLHALDRRVEDADFIVGALLDAVGQVAAGDAVEQPSGLVQRAEDRAREHRVHAHHQRRHHGQRGDQERQRTVDAGGRFARHALAHFIGEVHILLNRGGEDQAQRRDLLQVQLAGLLRLAGADGRDHRRDGVALMS